MSDGTQGDLFAPPDPVATAPDLGTLHALIRRCPRCAELAEYRTQPVPGVGPEDARVFFIGVSPYLNLDRMADLRAATKGRQPIGRRGSYLL